MPRPSSEAIVLTSQARTRLESLARASSTPQALAFRGRIILRAAADDHPTNLRIAAELACHRHTVGSWRSRYLRHGLDGLQDAPRSGRPRVFPPLATPGRHLPGQ